MPGRTTSYIIQTIYRAVGFKKFSTAHKQLKGQMQAQQTSTKKAVGAQKSMNKGMMKGAPMMGDFVKAMQRAMIVAPVWLALRAAMMQVISTIREGYKYWMEFDEAMRKAEQVMHGVIGNMTDAVASLTKQIRQLSKETGKSMKELTDTFYRFGTVGLDTETSIQGMTATTKLATVMFGRNEQVAKVLASTYRLLGDNMSATVPEMKKMEVMGGMIYKLWKTNAFELDEFTSALERFLPVANTFNMTVDESMALMATLHTAAVRSSRAGRLLGTSMQRLVGNLDQVGTQLGIKVTPELEGTTQALMKVLARVKQLNEEGRKIPDIEHLTIFGGVRQRQAAQALISVFDTLVDNMRAVNLETGQYQDLLDDVDDKFDDIIDSVHKQVEIFQNLKKQAGEAFVKSVVGGEDFKESMKDLNEYVEDNLIPSLEVLGQTLKYLAIPLQTWDKVTQWMVDRAVADPETDRYETRAQAIDRNTKSMILLKQATQALHGEFEKPVVENIIKQVEDFSEELEKGGTNVEVLLKNLREAAEVGKVFRVDVEGLDEIKEAAEKTRKLRDEYNRMVNDIQKEIRAGVIEPGVVRIIEPETSALMEIHQDITKVVKEQFDEHIEIGNVVKEKLGLLEQELKYSEMIRQGYTDAEISQAKLNDYIAEQVKLFNKTDAVQVGRVKAAKEEAVLAAVMAGNYKEVLRIFNQTGIEQEKLVELKERAQEISENELKLQENIYQSLTRHVEQMLRIQGASTSEIIEAKSALEDKLGINQDAMSLLNRELDLQRAITEEQLNRNRATSETVELWKIALQFGDQRARQIKEFLRGERELADLSKTTRRIAADRFTGRVEESLARQHWGREDVLRPKAERPEQILAETMRTLPHELSRSIEQALQLMPPIQPQFEVINNIQIDGTVLGEAAVKKVDTEIKDRNSQTRNDIRKAVQDDMNRGDIR